MKKRHSARQSSAFPYTLVEVLVVVVMVLIIVFVVKGCNTVREKGLKNVGTELWEGPKK